MKHFDYKTCGTCSKLISFDIDTDDTVHNVKFYGGCDGNLKMISKFVEGMDGKKVISLCKGNLCGNKGTSCADQMACAVDQAMHQVK